MACEGESHQGLVSTWTRGRALVGLPISLMSRQDPMRGGS